jgi:hypothetical protein
MFSYRFFLARLHQIMAEECADFVNTTKEILQGPIRQVECLGANLINDCTDVFKKRGKEEAKKFRRNIEGDAVDVRNEARQRLHEDAEEVVQDARDELSAIYVELRQGALNDAEMIADMRKGLASDAEKLSEMRANVRKDLKLGARAHRLVQVSLFVSNWIRFK